MRKKGCKGYLTVFLTLLLTLFVSLCLMLIEGVRANAIKLETEIAFDIAMDSTLAQYHRELFERYDLLAVDSSYGEEKAGLFQTEQKLSEFFAANLSYVHADTLFWKRDFLAIEEGELEIKGAACLTDDSGKLYRNLCCESVAGLVADSWEQLQEWSREIEINHLEDSTVSEEGKSTSQEIDAMLSEEEMDEKNPEAYNPSKTVQDKLSLGLSNLVIGDRSMLSNKGIVTEALFSTRREKNQVNRGNLKLNRQEYPLEKVLFIRYLTQHFSTALKPEEGVLNYGLEYLIAGKDTDIKNLDSILLRLFGIRESLNAIYLYSDSFKCAEAEALGLTAALLLGQPELAEVFKHSILLSWISAESICDLKRLMQGKGVPFYKTKESWSTDLASALAGIFGGSQTEIKGPDYQDYLIMLLLLTNEEKLSDRALNLTEANIRLTQYNDNFRIDACYVGFQGMAGVKSGFGYINSIERIFTY